MFWLFDLVPYILAIGTILLGAFEIVKDWGEYRALWLRIAVSLVFMVVASLSLASLHHDKQEKKDDKIKADGEMKTLQGKVDAANQAQVNNTKLYVDSFQKMSEQISDLKSEVKTEALQKKLAAVQTELQNTQKAMAPGPKAELTFTFVPFSNPAPPAYATPKKEVTVPLNSDGSIHVEFSIMNMTGVDALQVELNLVICDQCKFAKEPSGPLTKLPGLKDTIRYLNIPNLEAQEAFQTISLDIIPEPGITEMPIAFTYRCHTCPVHPGNSPETSGVVHIQRP
jgi:hypothetical protein